jgi:N-methylhydantoinase A/oxoprolinase/acetone carboxylase beta subunit
MLVKASDPPPSVPARVVLEGRVLEARRIRRRDLRAGHILAGPVVVQEYSATTWLPPGHSLAVDASGCLHLTADATADSTAASS